MIEIAFPVTREFYARIEDLPGKQAISFHPGLCPLRDVELAFVDLGEGRLLGLWDVSPLFEAQLSHHSILPELNPVLAFSTLSSSPQNLTPSSSVCPAPNLVLSHTMSYAWNAASPSLFELTKSPHVNATELQQSHSHRVCLAVSLGRNSGYPSQFLTQRVTFCQRNQCPTSHHDGCLRKLGGSIDQTNLTSNPNFTTP